MAEKTILQDFLEKRPDIKGPVRIVDRFCPEQAGYDPVYNKDCHKWTCLECWNRPVTSQKAFRDLQKIRELIARAEVAEAEVEKLRNEHLKIQYNGEELTVQEICERLDDLQNKVNKYECEIRNYAESCEDCNFCKMEG